MMQPGSHDWESRNMGYYSKSALSGMGFNMYEGGLADGGYNNRIGLSSNGASRFGDRLVEPVQALALAHPQSPAKELVPVIEAAEFALRNQMEENDQLRHALRSLQRELQNRVLENEQLRYALKDDQQEIPKSKLEQQLGSLQIDERLAERPPPVSSSEAADFLHQADGSSHIHSRPVSMNKDIQVQNMYSASSQGYQNNGLPLSGQPSRAPVVGSSNGIIDPYRRNIQPPNQSHVDSGSLSHISSPSSRSTSPSRGHRGVELDTKLQTNGHGPAQHMPSFTNYNYQQPEVILRTSRMLEEECFHLRRLLLDASIKEAHMLREMRGLQRNLAELHMAYDQQQQGLADAASKALSYRHDILVENVHLNNSLQVAEQDKALYVSSLLPLLAEFDLQPTVPDAHSIVTAVKVLVQRLQAKIRPTEVRDSQLYGPSWQPYFQNVPYTYGPRAGVSQPPLPPYGHGLEIVPQQSYLGVQRPGSPSSPLNLPNSNWETSGTNSGLGMETERELSQQVGSERQALSLQGSGSGNNYSTQQEPRSNVSRMAESDAMPKSTETLSDSEGDDPVNIHERVEQATHSPHLPPLPEETVNPIYEDDDPLPAVDELRIVGDARLGGKLTACGQSINGTSVCIFQWVRYYQNGDAIPIDGAAQPAYTITADDCDTRIAIDCVPMDERQRKGELVRVYANDQNPIRCDPMLQDQINSYILNGHASFDVHFVVEGASDERGTLTLKRSSYELRRNNVRKPVVNEKYSSYVDVKIPVEQCYQCSITSNDGKVHYLDFRDNRIRDVVVLTMRHFLKAAFDRRTAKRTLPWLSKMVQ